MEVMVVQILLKTKEGVVLLLGYIMLELVDSDPLSVFNISSLTLDSFEVSLRVSTCLVCSLIVSLSLAVKL